MGKKFNNGKTRYESSSDDEEEARFSCFSQVVIPVEEERVRTPGLEVRWSTVDKEEAVKLTSDGMTASCPCGYRAVRASHGVSVGCWYYELEVGAMSKEAVGGVQGGHCRVGWAMDRVSYEDLEAPIGYSPDMDEPDPFDEADDTDAGGERSSGRRPRYGMSFAYASKTGAVYTRSRRIDYGEAYAAGDVVGCMIELNKMPPPPMEPNILNEGTKYHCPLWMEYWVDKRPEHSPGARISFFKNGVFQGHAFEDIWCGTYYPAASFYYGGSARANFGPDFRFPTKVPPSKGGDSAGVAAVASGGTAAGCFKYRPVSEIAAEEQVWR